MYREVYPANCGTAFAGAVVDPQCAVLWFLNATNLGQEPEQITDNFLQQRQIDTLSSSSPAPAATVQSKFRVCLMQDTPPTWVLVSTITFVFLTSVVGRVLGQKCERCTYL